MGTPEQKTINKKNIDDVIQIAEISHSQMGVIAHLMWGYYDGSGGEVRQLNIIPTYNANNDMHISYDGNIKYKEKGFNEGIVSVRKRDILFPSNGSIYKMTYLKPHFFNDIEPLMCNLNYNIDVNNSSMIMDNISIFNEDYTSGVMINLRVSFEGSFSSETVDGNINVLWIIDEIG